ncbi:MAG: hypothetical protein HUJ25_14730 [Crocinitomicaceae bacterium]|nr:hypothetical protein [Crocinitomicaceae bacterium]
MDKSTKNILILVGAVVVAAIVLKLVFTYWWSFIVAAVAFGLGYMLGKSSHRSKK